MIKEKSRYILKKDIFTDEHLSRDFEILLSSNTISNSAYVPYVEGEICVDTSILKKTPFSLKIPKGLSIRVFSIFPSDDLVPYETVRVRIINKNNSNGGDLTLPLSLLEKELGGDGATEIPTHVTLFENLTDIYSDTYGEISDLEFCDKAKLSLFKKLYKEAKNTPEIKKGKFEIKASHGCLERKQDKIDRLENISKMDSGRYLYNNIAITPSIAKKKMKGLGVDVFEKLKFDDFTINLETFYLDGIYLVFINESLNKKSKEIANLVNMVCKKEQISPGDFIKLEGDNIKTNYFGESVIDNDEYGMHSITNSKHCYDYDLLYFLTKCVTENAGQNSTLLFTI